MRIDKGRTFESSISSKFVSFASYVYSWVAGACAITALSAYFLYTSGLFMKVLPFWWVISLSTFALGMFIRSKLSDMNSMTLSLCFVGYAVLEGIFFGTVLPLFVASSSASIVWVAFASASLMFTICVLYGSYTKTDLTTMGSLALMSLFGLCILSIGMLIASFFVDITFMHLVVSYIGLVIFLALTAFESQRIHEIGKGISLKSDDANKLALMAALGMYSNLIAIFWYTLRILSSDRNR